MNSSAIYFVKDKFNKYSIKALLAAIERLLPELRVQVISFSDVLEVQSGILFYSFNSRSADAYVALATQIRQSNKQIVQVCGGAHPSARSDEMRTYFDAVCVGEGEYVVVDLIQRFLSGKRPEGVFRSDRSVDLDAFIPFSLNNRIFGPIELTRGCKFACAYCQVPQLYGHQLRHRSLENVYEMVKLSMANQKYDIRFITPDATSYLYDDGVNTKAIYDLLSGTRRILGDNGRLFFGSFPSEINPYYVNEDIIRYMREYCDNHTVVIGLQSASKKMLKKLGRPSDIDTVETAIELLIQYGFNVDVDFILGMPGEDDDSIADNMAWIDRWKMKVRIHAHYYMPLPSSRWENEKPLDIPLHYVRFLKSLEGKSRIYGHWQNQKKLVESTPHV